jgi:hypothetical protein
LHTEIYRGLASRLPDNRIAGIDGVFQMSACRNEGTITQPRRAKKLHCKLTFAIVLEMGRVEDPLPVKSKKDETSSLIL